MKVADVSLSDIAISLRDGNLSSQELWEKALAGHNEFNTELNAYKEWTPKLAKSASQSADAAFDAGYELGPLQGIPVSVKDIFGVSGLPTFAGSPMRLPKKWEREGPVIGALKSQLAVMSGKTHCVEFCAGGIGDNIHWSAPRNPWDDKQHRGPGGSSSGAGVSIWEGSAYVAFGSDTMGSVRIPASMTGLVGLKVTYGRWSNEGIVPLRAEQDTPGFLVKSVEDAVYVFETLDPQLNKQVKEPPKKIGDIDLGEVIFGVADNCLWEGCAPGITKEVHQAINELKKIGAKFVDVPSPQTAELLSLLISGGLPNCELWEFLSRELPDWIEHADPLLIGRLENARQISMVDYLAQENWLTELAKTIPSNFEDVDVTIAPTVPITPPVIIDEGPILEQEATSPLIAARNTCPVNFFGQCAITLPVGTDALNMPVGMQLTAQGGEEEKLLSVALAVEKILGKPQERIGEPPLVSNRVAA